MMNRKNAFFGYCLFIWILSGCASLNQTETKVRLSASGHAKITNSLGQSALQRRYQVEQQATLNAYRQLAALLFQQTIKPGVSVADQVLRDETFRLYFDTFLREAKIRRNTNHEYSYVVLDLLLDDRFYQCMSDPDKVQGCLQAENKIAFSRIGNREALYKTVNLHCQMPDCSDQFSIAGFSRENNILNSTLLQAGIYDAEWLLNISAQIAVRYLLLTEFPPTR